MNDGIQKSLDALMQAVLTHKPLAEIEVLYIRYVLAHKKGNKSNAAPLLGVDRRTIQRKLSRRIPDPEETKPFPLTG